MNVSGPGPSLEDLLSDMDINDGGRGSGDKRSKVQATTTDQPNNDSDEEPPAEEPPTKRQKRLKPGYITLAHYNLLMHGKQFVPPHRL
jgi:hypothetical protein